MLKTMWVLNHLTSTIHPLWGKSGNFCCFSLPQEATKIFDCSLTTNLIIILIIPAQNGLFGLDQSRWLVAGWVGGAFCVASYVHGHHSVYIRSLMHGECCRLSAREKFIPTWRYWYVIYVTIAFILFSPQSGDTALHMASMNGHPEVVKLLLQSHTDVNVKGASHSNAL